MTNFNRVIFIILGCLLITTESEAIGTFLRRPPKPKINEAIETVETDFIAKYKNHAGNHKAVSDDGNTHLIFDELNKGKELTILELGRGEPHEISFPFRDFDFSAKRTKFDLVNEYDKVKGRFLIVSMDGGNESKKAVYELIEKDGKTMRVFKSFEKVSKRDPAFSLSFKVKNNEIIIQPPGKDIPPYKINPPWASDAELLDVKLSGSGTHLEVLYADGTEYVFRRDNLMGPFPQTPWLTTFKKSFARNHFAETKLYQPPVTYSNGAAASLEVQGTR
jgi:hypothetical protein